MCKVIWIHYQKLDETNSYLYVFVCMHSCTHCCSSGQLFRKSRVFIPQTAHASAMGSCNLFRPSL